MDPRYFLTAFAVSLLFAQTGARAETPTYTSTTYPIRHATGLVRTDRSQAALEALGRTSFTGRSASTPVPGSYSMRGHAGPVENQGQCGSCWDFSLTTVLRGTGIMSGKDPGRLSFNYLLNCAKDMDGCNGGDFPAAAYFVKPEGAPAYGSDGSYTGTQGTCESEPAIASTTTFSMLGSGGSNPSFEDIAYVVGVLHQPVSIDVAANQDWENYSSGVYNKCNDEGGAGINHMVAIEGYSCEGSVDSKGNCAFNSDGNLPPGVGTWVIRNSWGTSWGDQGYITTKATDSKGSRCNAVATDALYYELK